MPAVAEVAPEIKLVPIEDLVQHPQNPRGTLKKDDPQVLELKASIEKLGQKVPCLVRPKGDGYETVLGHRRTFVQTLLGAEAVPCVVEDLTDELALAIMLAEHATHVAPDPFLEAEAVATLLERPGWTLQHVSDHLGKSVRWVALRANLVNLAPKVKKAVEKLDWPLEWVEDLARLTKDSQEQLVDPKQDWNHRIDNVHDKDDLDQLLGDAFHQLGKAPFDITDATICPKAGACTTCPKTSLRAPGLFDDGELDPADPKSIKKAICRDSICWREKKDAKTKAAIAVAKEKAGKGATLVTEDYAPDLVPAGMKAERLHYGQTIAKKEAKGATKPVVVLKKDGSVETGFVKERAISTPKPKRDPEKKPAKDENPKKVLTASRKEIAARREKLVLEKIVEAINESKAPAHAIVLGLVAAFDVGEDWESYDSRGDEEPLAMLKKDFDLAVKEKAWDEAVWKRVRGSVTERINGYQTVFKGELLDAYIEWITALLEIDLEPITAAVLKEIPNPKWWPPEPSNFMADAVTPGVCRGCGCTHLAACPGGCAWVEMPDVDGVQKKVDGEFLPQGLCSSCAGAQPKGKKKKAKAARG